jgi:hypothetical protein
MYAILLMLVMVALTSIVWRCSRPARRSRNLVMLGLLTWVALLSLACAVNPVQLLEGMLPIIAGIIPIIAAAGEAVLPAEAALIQAGANLVTAGIKALLDVLKSYNTAPSDNALAKVTAAFSAVQANLSELEVAAEIKNAVVAKKIIAVVNGVVATLAMIEADITAKHPATVVAAQAQTSQ